MNKITDQKDLIGKTISGIEIDLFDTMAFLTFTDDSYALITTGKLKLTKNILEPVLLGSISLCAELHEAGDAAFINSMKELNK